MINLLLGFEGQDLTAPIFEQMRRQDLGGLVFESRNYLDPQQIASMAGEGPVIAADEGHIPPFVMVSDPEEIKAVKAAARTSRGWSVRSKCVKE